MKRHSLPIFMAAALAVASILAPQSIEARASGKAASSKTGSKAKSSAAGKSTGKAKHHAKGKKQAGETFAVGPNTKIRIPGNKHATLADLAVGELVRISYGGGTGGLVADRIKLVVPHPPTAKPAQHKAHKAHAAKPAELHARGVIQSINAAQGTLTITKAAKHKHHAGGGKAKGQLAAAGQAAAAPQPVAAKQAAGKHKHGKR